MKLSEIISRLEAKFPKQNAESWDNVGLLVGNKNNDIKKIQISLDVTSKVIDEAIKNKVDLIISHHPLIFSAIKEINTDSLIGEKILKLIENKISVYSLHTNLDSSKYGLNEFVGEKLGFFDGKIIDPIKESFYRGEVYTKENIEEELKKEKLDFRIEKLENIYKNIIVSEKNKIYSVVEKLKRKLLVEEVFIFELDNKFSNKGIGRIYSLKEKKKILEIVKMVKEKLELDNLKVSGYDLENTEIKKIAIVNGAGSSYWKKAKRMGANLLITGDLKYHEALDAKEEGMYIIDVGHYESEYFFHEIIKDVLEDLQEIHISVFNDEPAMKYL